MELIKLYSKCTLPKLFALVLVSIMILTGESVNAQIDFTYRLRKMDRESLRYTFLYENIDKGSHSPFKSYIDFYSPFMRQYNCNCITEVYKLDRNVNCEKYLRKVNSNVTDSFIILKKNELKKARFSNGYIDEAALGSIHNPNKAYKEKYKYSNSYLDIFKYSFDTNGILSQQYKYYFDTLKRLKVVERVDEFGNVLNKCGYYYNENTLELDSVIEDGKIIFKLLTVPVNPQKRELHKLLIKYMLSSKFKKLPGIEMTLLINKLDTIKHSYTTQDLYKIALIDYFITDSFLVYIKDYLGGKIIGIDGDKSDLMSVQIFDFKKQVSLELKIILGSKGIVNKNSFQLKAYSYSFYKSGERYDKTTYSCTGCHRYRFKERGMKNIWRDVRRERTQCDGRKNYIHNYNRFLIFN